ncbi:type I phosphomannose isomerase catalytic subunit [Tengunoibacter tsumagoiensis]|uniref:Mannose-6-phosphate isomerase n=1 Tax=Tengunoibacter tsumagoiensis TaxID=2014871 RepID=A0A402A2H7_9CHLR|nr:type I phosphomannose isomerase catalytic subunit [Tengunoibacter tsumagoiensis]GCE13201.1 mannose-6-phosphate isomerase [Tengunoibacter tsumagoiensis]
MSYLYPIRLHASLHETLWGGRRLERDQWKELPQGESAIGEAWETEISTIVQNGPYQGQTLGELVKTLDAELLGQQAINVFGHRFPLLAKFIDANAKLSVQVHPTDSYSDLHEGGKLGKTEFWYILAAEPGASIVHGFQAPVTCEEVEQAIENVTLEGLLHEEQVQAGDVIFVPAGTVHAIGSDVLLYELQEYSDVTYRMYDYGRLTAAGKPRELHIKRSLDVSYYGVSPKIKMDPVVVASEENYQDRALVACRYFLTREISLKAGATMAGQTTDSCIIITSVGAELQVNYGDDLSQSEVLSRGQTLVLPAALGTFSISGLGSFLYSYVPNEQDTAWQHWNAANKEVAL